MSDFNELEKLRELYVKFWYNTTFYETSGGNMAMSYEDFKELADMCIYLERGQ